ncbi:MAG: type II toxin-antitoxin system RelE/ParE family toxin [Myxococcaceae bacterium]
MARVEFSPGVFDDLERFRAHLEDHEVDPPSISTRIAQLISAIRVLAGSPEIGRPAGRGSRELIVGKRASGYVVLYRYVPQLELVLILAVRHQREERYRPRR